MLYSNNLLPLITKPTRLAHHTSTLTDHIYANSYLSVNAGIALVNVSDHSILQYHAPPSWIEGRTKTRLDGHPGRHACLANMA